VKKIVIFVTIGLSLIINTYSQQKEEQKTTAAVMDLEAKEGISKGVTSTLSDYLRTQLVNTDKYIIVTRENMEEILKEQQFQAVNCTSDRCIVEAGKLLGVRKMFAGSIGKVGITYIISLRIINIQSGKIEKAETEKCYNCEEDSLLTSIENIAYGITGLQIPSSFSLNNLNLKFPSINTEKSLEYSNEGKRFYYNNDYDNAVRNSNKAIEMNSGNTVAYILLAVIASTKNNYNEAIKNYTKAIELCHLPDLYLWRGSAYSRIDNYSAAIEDFNKAIEFDYKNVPAWVNRGISYYKKGDYDKAISDSTIVIQMDSQNALAYFVRACAFGKIGFKKEASADLEKAYKLDPNLKKTVDSLFPE